MVFLRLLMSCRIAGRFRIAGKHPTNQVQTRGKVVGKANEGRMFSLRLERLFRQLLFAMALLLIGAPIAHDIVFGRRIDLYTAGTFSVVSGMLILSLSLGWRVLPGPIAKLSLAAVAVVGILALLEVCGRFGQLDYARVEASWSSTPIYFRQPIEPVDPVFFRRPGPDHWEGRVLTTELERNRFHESNAYPNEESIVVEYDEQGFRNPRDLHDWEIVIVGDSFTELGYLADDQLTSSVLANALNRSVKNLGVSFTGTLNQTRLLELFGIAESTTDAVLVFFEGNDVLNTSVEFRSLQQFEEDGTRDYRDLEQQRQNSLLVTIRGLFRIRNWRGRSVVNASCNLADAPTELTVTYTPERKQDLDPQSVLAIETAIKEYAEFLRDKGIRPWLVYMPCKRRVLDGHLRFHEKCSPELVNWQGTDLPEWIQGECELRGIRFLDLTPELVRKTESGEMMFNTVYDTHLNREGAAYVADLIANAMRPVLDQESGTGGAILKEHEVN